MAKEKVCDELEVEFLSVSHAKKTRLGVKMVRNGSPLSNLNDAETFLDGAKLRCDCACDPNAEGDTEGQETLHADKDALQISFECETNGFRSQSPHLTFGLFIHQDDVNQGALDRFARTKGTMNITKLGKVGD
jgi:hypothetical protein